MNEIGFNLVGYGCTTCIGNSGPLDPRIEEVITRTDLIAASVLSGNRNFEARVHQSVKANFLMSPPLVVAFALAGRVNIDISQEPIGQGRRTARTFTCATSGRGSKRSASCLSSAFDPETYRRLYNDFAEQNPLWNEIPTSTGDVYEWDTQSTYIQEPPYFEKFSSAAGQFCDIKGARPLAIFGDSVTTDHISPAGAIKPNSPAGLYLQEHGVAVEDFNSYGSRRGNHQVMVRGTFANVRIKNLMVPGTEGGVTVHQPDGERMSIYDASVQYQAAGRSAHRLRRSGVRHGQLARLGGEGHAAARRQGGRRPELRAHTPQQSGRHGRPALPVQRRHERRDAQSGRHGDVRHHRP